MKSLLFALLLPAVAFAQAPVIQISGANFRPMPLAVPAPRVATENARPALAQFDDAWHFDLTAAGIFQVLDRKSYLADPKEGFTAATIDFSRWADVGAEVLVKTQLSVEGNQLQAELRAFTVASGTQTFRTQLSGRIDQPRRLAHALANALYRQFTHEKGPFEAKLAFVKRTAQGKDVFVSDWDGQNALAASRGGINLLPALSPAETAVAFTSYRSGKPEIWQAPLPGKMRLLARGGTMDTGVAFSPDGRHIAYSVAQADSAQIWVANADGSGAKKLTDTPYFLNTSPDWSPDGKRIAFVSNRGGSPQIYLMNADGSGVRRLTFQGNYNQTPSWSPRGDLIAFTARDERNVFDIFTVEVDTGKINRLTQDQGNNEEPSFSPNGRLVVFSSNRTGQDRLFVMTADGNDQQPLPTGPGDFTTPDWGR